MQERQASHAQAGPTRNVTVQRPEQEIMEAITGNDVCLLCGETGSGKTTQARRQPYGAITFATCARAALDPIPIASGSYCVGCVRLHAGVTSSRQAKFLFALL